MQLYAKSDGDRYQIHTIQYIYIYTTVCIDQRMVGIDSNLDLFYQQYTDGFNPYFLLLLRTRFAKYLIHMRISAWFDVIVVVVLDIAIIISRLIDLHYIGISRWKKRYFYWIINILLGIFCCCFFSFLHRASKSEIVPSFLY